MSGTAHTFDLVISDVDRGVYETLSLKTQRHPSESAEYLFTRVLAYALEYTDGIAFTQGLSVSDEPAVWVRDLTGALVAWIEVGAPDAARLHKASKACGRVVVYCHKDIDAYLRSLAGHKIHASERVSVVEVDRALIAALVARLERRTALQLSVSEGTLYVDAGGEALAMPLVRRPVH
ncbi:MAG: YaeQ family protein [Myxococcota bacterium]